MIIGRVSGVQPPLTMSQLLSARRNLFSGLSKSLSRFQASKISSAPSGDKEEKFEDPNVFLNPDWYRTPQESDGPRCITPDYPDVPYVSHQFRSPYAQYTHPQARRNWGEPVHELGDMLSTQNFDVEPTYSIGYMLKGLAIAGGVFVGAIQILNYFDDKDGWRRDVVPREYPYLHKYQMNPPSPLQPQTDNK